MNLEGLEAIIDLIEMGAMSSNKDIAKCLRSAVAAIKERMSTENAHERKWVSLTDDEIEVVSGNYTESEGFKHGARWALEQLKELNT